MKDVDYKQKYKDLRARFVNSMDVAFRMGYEKGISDARQEQAQMQAQQAQMQMQAQAAQGQVGAGQDAGAPQEAGAQDAGGGEMQPVQPGQEELDQYIAELEGLVNKAEGEEAEKLKKSLEKIKNFQMLSKIKISPMKKAATLSPVAAVNLTANAKKELSMQEKIIDDIMAKWEKEAPKSTSEAMRVIGTEALTKKE